MLRSFRPIVALSKLQRLLPFTRKLRRRSPECRMLEVDGLFRCNTGLNYAALPRYISAQRIWTLFGPSTRTTLKQRYPAVPGLWASRTDCRTNWCLGARVALRFSHHSLQRVTNARLRGLMCAMKTGAKM